MRRMCWLSVVALVLTTVNGCGQQGGRELPTAGPGSGTPGKALEPAADAQKKTLPSGGTITPADNEGAAAPAGRD